MFLEATDVQNHYVALFAFDGCDYLHPIIPFTHVEDINAATFESGITSYTWDDPSTSLDGAIEKSIYKLYSESEFSCALQKKLNLIVFSDFVDSSGRNYDGPALVATVSPNPMNSFYAIGIDGEVDVPYMRSIGVDGSFVLDQSNATLIAQMEKVFTFIGNDISNDRDNDYLFGFCTPKRAGVGYSYEIYLKTTNFTIYGGITDSLTGTFDATDMEYDCDATTFAEALTDLIQCNEIEPESNYAVEKEVPDFPDSFVFRYISNGVPFIAYCESSEKRWLYTITERIGWSFYETEGAEFQTKKKFRNSTIIRFDHENDAQATTYYYNVEASPPYDCDDTPCDEMIRCFVQYFGDEDDDTGGAAAVDLGLAVGLGVGLPVGILTIAIIVFVVIAIILCFLFAALKKKKGKLTVEPAKKKEKDDYQDQEMQPVQED